MKQSLNQSQLSTEAQAGPQMGMALLEAGIPLSLLLDLVTLDVTRSRDIAHSERADTGWIHAAA
jgi:hypothetical protein